MERCVLFLGGMARRTVASVVPLNWLATSQAAEFAMEGRHMNRRGAMNTARQSRNQKDRRNTESWQDRIMQREEKPLHGHLNVREFGYSV